MANTIKVTPDEKGRAIITLYGTNIDVTDKADKNGKGFLHFAGDDYNFEIIGAAKPAKKKTEKKVKEVEKVEIKEFNKDGSVDAEVDGEEMTLTPGDAETEEAVETLKTLEEERNENDEA
jgi:hypothetical protein